MTDRILTSILVLSLLGTTSPSAFAQASGATQSRIVNAQNWQHLLNLKPGKKIKVEFKPNIGEPVEGKFVEVKGSTLVISDDGYQLRLEQRDIQRVYRIKGKWSRETTARIGAGVGMLVGTMLGAARALREERNNPLPSDADTAPLFAGFFLGSLAGAGVGALLGGKRTGKLLYEAR